MTLWMTVANPFIIAEPLSLRVLFVRSASTIPPDS